jgi:hypothetical protein
MTFLGVDSAEHMEDQIVDLMDTDLGNPSEMEKAIMTLNSSSLRTIMLSSGAGTSKYSMEIKSEAVSGKRLLTMDNAHIERAVEIIKEQDNRRLNFAMEIVGGSISCDIQRMIHDRAWYVSEEYYPVYQGVKARWRITRARIVTNNAYICRSITSSIAGRKIARAIENRTIRSAVTKGTIMTTDVSIIDRGNQRMYSEDRQDAENMGRHFRQKVGQ